MIRKALNNDYNYLKLLIMDNFGVEYKEDTPFCNWLVYEEKNKIIGFINYDTIYEKSELEYIYVDEKYRKKGIGQMLFNAMMTDLNNKNITNMTLEVNTENNIAIDFYKKNGFKVVSIRNNYYHGNDAYLMLKSW